MRAAVLLTTVLVTTAAGWVDRHRTAREAARLYVEEKFDQAAAKYNEALIDDPDSALLHYNLGAAAYRQGRFEDARGALASVAAAEGDPGRTARAAYNMGNAIYRLGAAAEGSEPQKALELHAQALVAFRRAMGVDPRDEDAKFNHELVEKKIADLKKKLEEQQKQNEEQQEQTDQQQEQKDQQQEAQDEQQEQPQNEQREERQQQNDQQQADQQRPEPAEQKQEDEQARQGSEPEPTPSEQPDAAEPPGEGAGGAPDTPGEMSQRDAEALLDAERNQEVRPDEIVKQLQGAAIAEPREDW